MLGLENLTIENYAGISKRNIKIQAKCIKNENSFMGNSRLARDSLEAIYNADNDYFLAVVAKCRQAKRKRNEKWLATPVKEFRYWKEFHCYFSQKVKEKWRIYKWNKIPLKSRYNISLSCIMEKYCQSEILDTIPCWWLYKCSWLI